MEKAYCYATGLVGFGDKLPKGALPIGTLKVKREKFTVHCRLAYNGKDWLVPGIPEAADQSAGVDALMTFRERVASLGLIEF